MHQTVKYGWLALFAAPMLISATNAGDASKDTVLSVSGVGYSTSEGAEIFTINAGSTAFSRYPSRAMRDNAAVLEKLREQLADKGIDPRDVSTSNFAFRRGSDPDDRDGDRDEGYLASQQLVVFVRNPDQAGTVIDAMVEAGATDVSVQNHKWWGGNRPPPAIEAVARKQAVADARKKADDYAAALGMRISRVVSVNDGGVHISGQPAPATARVTTLEVPTQIDNGESAVIATVSMQFELAPK